MQLKLNNLLIIALTCIVTVLLHGCASMQDSEQSAETGQAAGEAGATTTESSAKIVTLEAIKAHILKREFTEAEAKLRLRLLNDRDNAVLLANLGIVFSETNRMEDAEKMLRKAIEINDTLLPAYVRLASMLRTQGRIPEALEMNKKALEINPDYANAHYNLAILYDIYLQEPENALRHLEAYLKIVKDEDKKDESWKKQLERKMEAGRQPQKNAVPPPSENASGINSTSGQLANFK